MKPFNSENISDKEKVESFISLVRENNRGKNLKCYIRTFGCQQNEADSERLLGMVYEMGYSSCDEPDEADLILVNTCAVREHAEVKALSYIGRFKELKRKKPTLIIGVCGCIVAEEKVSRMLKCDFHYVSFAISPPLLHTVPALIYKFIIESKRVFLTDTSYSEIPENLPVVRSSSYKAWVSVMYGCNNFCSYCIVPYTRGRERSRMSADVINECKELVNSGIKEITLLGQNVNSYKSDVTFAELVERIALIDGDFTVRFMTSHPKDVSDELISVMGRHRDKVAPYFHLPLQSGSDKILGLMNRTYTKERFLSIVKALRTSVPGICISTDIIVGFPGESEDDFLDTLDVVNKAEFDMIYAFIYSEREGTPAAKMTGKVPKAVKEERLRRLLENEDPIALKKNRGYLDSTVRVLVDEVAEGEENNATGRTLSGKTVHFSAPDARVGEYFDVLITEAFSYHLIGKIK